MNSESKGIIIGLVGPSGAGKTLLQDRAVAQLEGRLAVLRSTTTRSPRGKDEDSYFHFVSESEFGLMRAAGKFANTAHYGGKSYGFAREDIDALFSNGKIAIAAIVEQGVRDLRASGYQVLTVRIVPVGGTSQVLDDPDRNLPQRVSDDADRAQENFRCEKLIYNDFSTGGAERAAAELVQFIKIAAS